MERFGAGYGDGTAVTGNKLIITNSTLRGKITGGCSAGSEEVSGNVVTLGAADCN